MNRIRVINKHNNNQLYKTIRTHLRIQRKLLKYVFIFIFLSLVYLMHYFRWWVTQWKYNLCYLYFCGKTWDL